MSSHCPALQQWKFLECFIHGPTSQQCLRACIIYELECEVGAAAAEIPADVHKAALAEFEALSNQLMVKLAACPIAGLINQDKCIEVIDAARVEITAHLAV